MNDKDITVIRCDRKNLLMRVEHNGKITVRVPRRVPEAEIKQFIESHREWMEKNIAALGEIAPPFTWEELNALADEALKYFPPVVARYAAAVGVTYGKITIRDQHKRWGSCSSQGNLNFNCTLMLAPESVREYVVVHELCHRRQMNHSPAFWQEVARVMPDYDTAREWLKTEGVKIIGRIP